MPFLERADAKISYEIFGEGPPLLLLAATAFHGGVWKYFDVPELARTFQVIIFDQRGTGKSTTQSTGFSTPILADDALALLDSLNLLSAHILGHSNGGRVAQFIAANYPDRVRSLILASPGGTHKTRGISVSMCRELVENGYAGYSRMHAIRTGCRSNDPLEQERADRFLEEFIENLAPLDVFLNYVVSRQETNTNANLAAINVPVLIMVGNLEGEVQGDRHMEFAKEISLLIPNATLEVIPQQRHFYLFLQPSRIHELIRNFLFRQ